MNRSNLPRPSLFMTALALVALYLAIIVPMFLLGMIAVDF